MHIKQSHNYSPRKFVLYCNFDRVVRIYSEPPHWMRWVVVIYWLQFVSVKGCKSSTVPRGTAECSVLNIHNHIAVNLSVRYTRIKQSCFSNLIKAFGSIGRYYMFVLFKWFCVTKDLSVPKFKQRTQTKVECCLPEFFQPTNIQNVVSLVYVHCLWCCNNTALK